MSKKRVGLDLELELLHLAPSIKEKNGTYRREIGTISINIRQNPDMLSLL